jgi:putative oxidoreductase
MSWLTESRVARVGDHNPPSFTRKRINASTQKGMTDTGLFLIRAILAVVFIYHGSQKLFGWFGGYGIEGTAGWMASVGIAFPTLSAILAGATEFVGGIALLVGTGTRLAAIPMAFTMLVAVATTHRGFNAQTGGMEYPLTLCVILLALVLLGPGSFTVGNLAAKAKRKRDALKPAEALDGRLTS